MRLDHVVLWTKDVRASMDFYTNVVGLAPVRFDEFEAGEAPFPSVRVSGDSIIDLMPAERTASTESTTRVDGSAGHRVNHVCLAMSKAEYDELDGRLRAAGVDTGARLNHSFGAQGWAPQGYYFPDPDGNVVELLRLTGPAERHARVTVAAQRPAGVTLATLSRARFGIP